MSDNHITALEQAARNEKLENDRRAAKYDQAVADWVLNKAKAEGVGAKVPPAPVCEFKVKYLVDEVSEETTVVETSELASSKAAADFAPHYDTDDNAVGGPIGGPLPGHTNRFYQASGDRAPQGAKYTTPEGVSYIKEKEGFSIYWRRQ